MYIADINQASATEVENCLNNPECEQWFISMLFKHRYDTDEARVKRLMAHDNCPLYIPALVKNYRPAWLESSDAMAKITLAMLEQGGEQRWEKLQKQYRLDDLSSLYDDRDLRHLYKHFGEDDDSFFIDFDQGVSKEVAKRLPKFLLLTFKGKECNQWIAENANLQDLESDVEAMDPRFKALLAARKGISEALVQHLASDKSAAVRTALAGNSSVPEKTLLTLAKDKSKKTAQAALKSLPADARDKLLSDELSSTPASSRSDADWLVILRQPQIEPTQLMQVAKEASHLLCCAASIHPCADQSVHNAAYARVDLPPWAKLGIALNTHDPEQQKQLIAVKQADLTLALSSNNHLTHENAIALVKSTTNDRALANVANVFINDETVLQQIIVHKPKAEWVTSLKICLDQKMKATELRKILNKRKYRYLVLARLIARHPNCPKGSYSKLAYYLPNDLKQNPVYSLQALEKARTAQASPYDEWKIDDYLNSGHGPEFFNHWIIDNDKELANVRKTIAAYHVDPNKVRQLAILEDSHTHKRFIHERSKKFSDYEYRMLALVASPATIKQMIKSKPISKDLLMELTESKHKIVKMAARALASSKGYMEKEVVKASDVKSFGNKAARLVLAKSTADREILQLLAKDKTRDVRDVIAGRDCTEEKVLLPLLDDPDKRVASSAFYNIKRRFKTALSTVAVQDVLKRRAMDTTDHQSYRTNYFREVEDVFFRESQFEGGKGIFDNIILEKTDDTSILDIALKALKKGSRKISKHSLVKNPNLPVNDFMALINESSYLLRDKLENTESVSDFLRLYKQFPEASNRLRTERGFRFRREFGADELELLYKEFKPVEFCSMVGRQLHKLREEDLISVLNELANTSSDAFIRCIGNQQYTSAVKAHLLDIVISKNNHNWLSEYLYYYPVNEAQIDRFLQSKSQDVISAIVSGQKLTNQQLQQLCKSSNNEIKQELLYNDELLQRLPESFIRECAHSKNSDLREYARDAIRERGLDNEIQEPVSATVALKQNDVDISVVKFNKLLMEKGILEEHQRESSSKPGTFKKSKKLSDNGSSFGLNNENDYGDYNVQYFPSKFPELLKSVGLHSKE